LDAAIVMIGGQPRSGQEQMLDAVARTLQADTHLLVQAGTGTGKSLAYLSALMGYLVEFPKRRAVVATATLALQSQLIGSDIPVAADACEMVTGIRPRSAVMKGRSNYICLYRTRNAGVEQDALFPETAPSPTSSLGSEVVSLRIWAEDELESGGVGDRDSAPPHSSQAWGQVSVSGRECLGAAKCPFASECFAEGAAAKARASQLIVTNHALLAIDAMQGQGLLPEHEALVIDEAHELPDRVTSAATIDLQPRSLARLLQRARSHLTDETASMCDKALEGFEEELDTAKEGRVNSDSPLLLAVAGMRDALRKLISALGDPKDDLQLQLLVSSAKESYDAAAALSSVSNAAVSWVSLHADGSRALVQAPLDVAGLMGEVLFKDAGAVLTSATLTIGGDFTRMAASTGLSQADSALSTLDVGSPFDYRNQGILYVAKHLAKPGRDGVEEAVYEHIAELVEAAGGRTLGLFSSMRSAMRAAIFCREELDLPILLQGEAPLSQLTDEFRSTPEASLFGTLSLWQGVDVPGPTCQLVLIDRIPFPRPDDPLSQARSRAADEAGGSGFMEVSAAHAGLLLAQGAGRLIRTVEDRGVVAVLDSRLATARYGGYLRASMPNFWPTDKRDIVLEVLMRLDREAQANGK
jgi:ATP-dependent DNA helicase DinG